MENFNPWTVNELKEYLLQYDITINDIKGTGKNGRVIKKDLIRAANKVNKRKSVSLDKLTQKLHDINLEYSTPQSIILNDDVMNYIYHNINDIDTLVHICSTNKLTRNQCATKMFWEPILRYNNIEMPIVPYHNANEWIKYAIIGDKVNKLFKYVFSLSIDAELDVLIDFFVKHQIIKEYGYGVPLYYRKYILLVVQRANMRFLNKDPDNIYRIEVISTDEHIEYKSDIGQVKKLIIDLYLNNMVVPDV